MCEGEDWKDRHRVRRSSGSGSSDSTEPLRRLGCLPLVPTILQIQTLAAQPGTPSAFSRGADDAGARRRPANCCSPTEGRRTRAPEPSSPGAGGCWVLSGPGGGRAVSRCSSAPLQPISGQPAARSDLTKIAANACD